MKRLFIMFVPACLCACNGKNKAEVVPPQRDTAQSYIQHQPQNPYQFDSTAYTIGCANVFLQKISKDREYELMIELQFDSIPKFSKTDITRYPAFIKMHLNKYAKGNTYVNTICNDAPYFPKDWKQPVRYNAVSGSLTITHWSEKDFIVSALAEDIVLQDSAKRTITLPSETFKELKVRWLGG